MKLLVDVGNTALKTATLAGDVITLVTEADIPWSEIEEVLIAQVGKEELVAPLIARAQQLAIPHYQAKTSATLGGLTCAYPQFENLGVDRWLTVVACYHLYPQQSCVILDCGTASKIDVLNKAGQHLGGWILPGLDLMIGSLVSNTQKVFSDDTSPFLPELGTNTPNAVKNGALAATLGALEYYLSQSDDIPVIVCAGGYGELMQQHLARPSTYNDILVLQGLMYWRKYQQFA
ncbi:type III pantothenate kinase [Pseudoalteromonas sp. OOF1S-7]|uniref:type III pantothenate kinase n=1 Tax=Pseudoalteromonas sp. OOF1S-7 TaxID=2917757 RepID=UPI001EF53E05|nr:type III pantothenate kinase [Pseudoalteromonas sp. OOF1S-7]MCG7536017.1 type III pantothenate kinase [Pseudoalteromonas sp. OOF1S-7]